uniref:LigA n=1 Tax=Parastrongyloides trichosuri TaxID=131310 RepID=A0A0N4Z551_PARTI
MEPDLDSGRGAGQAAGPDGFLRRRQRSGSPGAAAGRDRPERFQGPGGRHRRSRRRSLLCAEPRDRAADGCDHRGQGHAAIPGAQDRTGLGPPSQGYDQDGPGLSDGHGRRHARDQRRRPASVDHQRRRASRGLGGRQEEDLRRRPVAAAQSVQRRGHRQVQGSGATGDQGHARRLSRPVARSVQAAGHGAGAGLSAGSTGQLSGRPGATHRLSRDERRFRLTALHGPFQRQSYGPDRRRRPGRCRRGGGRPGVQRRARRTCRGAAGVQGGTDHRRRRGPDPGADARAALLRQRTVRRPGHPGRLRPEERRGHQRPGCRPGFDRLPGRGADRFLRASARGARRDDGRRRACRSARRIRRRAPGAFDLGHGLPASHRLSIREPASRRARRVMAGGATRPCVWCRAAWSSPPTTTASAPWPSRTANVSSRSCEHEPRFDHPAGDCRGVCGSERLRQEGGGAGRDGRLLPYGTGRRGRGRALQRRRPRPAADRVLRRAAGRDAPEIPASGR